MLTLTPAVEAELNKPGHTVATLIEIRFNGATLYLTDGVDIEWSGATYLANGLFLGLDTIKEESNINAIETIMTFSAADQSIVAIILNNEQLNREVFIHTALIDPATGQVIPDPISQGRFLITGTAINDAKNAICSITIASYWTDFERKAGIATTHDSIRRVFPNEQGFINSKDIKEDLKWGGE